MGEIRPKTCEGRELTKDQLVPNRNSPPVPPALGCILLVALHDIIVDTAALLQVRQFYRRKIRLMEGATSFEQFATSKIVRSICANCNRIPCKISVKISVKIPLNFGQNFGQNLVDTALLLPLPQGRLPSLASSSLLTGAKAGLRAHAPRKTAMLPRFYRKNTKSRTV